MRIIGAVPVPEFFWPLVEMTSVSCSRRYRQLKKNVFPLARSRVKPRIMENFLKIHNALDTPYMKNMHIPLNGCYVIDGLWLTIPDIGLHKFKLPNKSNGKLLDAYFKKNLKTRFWTLYVVYNDET